MQMDERILAEECREGDGAARRELYDRFAGRLMAVCMRYAGDRATAEDLLHDAFLKIYGAFGKFSYRGPGSLRAWMERVMVNVALEHLRRNDVLSQSAALDDMPLEAYDEPEPDACDTIPVQVLMRFIGELPAGYRTVFNLYVMEGKSHKEIAALLGINEKSSASQLARAKAALAEKVKGWMKTNG